MVMCVTETYGNGDVCDKLTIMVMCVTETYDNGDLCNRDLR